MISLNVHRNTKGLTESAIITAIICILGIAGIYIPLLSILLFIIPTPIIVLGKKYGFKYALMSLIAASIVMITFSSPITALYIIALPGIPAVVIGMMMRKEMQPIRTIAAGTIAGIGITAFSFLLASKMMGVSIADNMQMILQQSSDIQEYMYSVMGADSQTMEKTKEMMQTMTDMVAVIIPSAIIVAAFFSCYFNYLLAGVILKRTGSGAPSFKPFMYFKLSKNAVQGIVIIGLLSFTVSYLNIVDKNTLMTNVYLLGQLVFIVEGLAVLVYYLNYYKMNKPLKIVIVLFAILSGFGSMALFIVGLMDIFIDFRKYKS